MAKTLNFNTLKKRYLTVTFADEKSTTIFVSLPTKAILDTLVDLNSRVKAVENENDFDIIGELYDICCIIMNRNKGGVKIDREFLEKVFDFDDILIFIKEYTSFIAEVVSQKN